MAVPAAFSGKLSLPVIGSPMFIISGPELVIAQCLSGVVGAFPALNARGEGEFERWIIRIETALAEARAADPARIIAPYAVNQIVHKSNVRLEEDLEIVVRHKVPVVITSLSSPDKVVKAVHGYGGLVFHDVASVRHAKKALEAGVDGLILLGAGAGGHGGSLNPLAFVGEVRKFYAGTIILSGAIARGEAILAAEALGADLAYIGTRFIATPEANAVDRYKQMIVEAGCSDIVTTNFFTGVSGNYLKPSIAAQGLDPDALPVNEPGKLDYGSTKPKTWKDIWGAGHGVGVIEEIAPVADVVARLKAEYDAARARLCRG